MKRFEYNQHIKTLDLDSVKVRSTVSGNNSERAQGLWNRVIGNEHQVNFPLYEIDIPLILKQSSRRGRRSRSHAKSQRWISSVWFIPFDLSTFATKEEHCFAFFRGFWVRLNWPFLSQCSAQFHYLPEKSQIGLGFIAFEHLFVILRNPIAF